MSLVELGFQYYPDPTKGKPVYNGFIYIGEPGTDPTIPGNQKTVTLRQESGVEVPATQPIRTGAGGVAVLNGSPVQVLVDGDYSLTVLNSKSAQVYHIPFSANIGDSSARIIVVSTVAELVALSLSDGQLVDTKGYYAAGDGGGASYLVVPSQAADGFGDHVLANGNVAVLQHTYPNERNAAQYGLLGGDSDVTANLQAALDSFVSVGSTNDATPLVYYNGTVRIPQGKHVIAGQILIPLGVSILGAPQSTNYNVGGLGDVPFGSTFWVTNTATLPVFRIEGKQLRGSAASIENISFSHGQTLRQAGEYPGIMFDMQGTFMYNIRNCDFFELGYSTALGASVNSNGVNVENCRFIKIGDANNQQAMPPASGYTYGNAVDFTKCFDSTLTNVFVESCGETGVTISTNTKVDSCFIDLCKTGIKSIGMGNSITGTSSKWNQDDGILLTNSSKTTITGGHYWGNNYKSSTAAATIGYGIRLDSTQSSQVVITGVDLVDAYEGIAGHNPYKTVRQASINLGSNPNSSAIITACWFSDEDAAWEATLKTNNPITDGQALIVAGKAILSDCMLEAGGATNLRSTPFTTANGTTLGSVTKRIAYRDKNGVVVGQIPLYDSIS